jgi:hypothetical protein
MVRLVTKYRNKAALRKISSGLWLALMLAALLIPSQALYTPVLAESSEPEFWAVMVGVTEYQCPFCIYDKEWNVYPVGVKHPDDSARDLATQLTPVAGDGHIKLVLNDQATNAGIYYAIQWLAEKANANDTALFYFCGHSAPQNLGSYDYFVSDRQLAEWLDGVHSQKVVVILDTCYAGSFDKELSQDGRVVMMSCQPAESSLEDRELKHAVFTHYVLQALSDFDNADTNGNNELSAKEIFDYANPKTVEEIVAPFANLPVASRGNIQHPKLYIPPNVYGDVNLFSEVIFHSDAESVTDAIVLTADGKPYLSKTLPTSFAWLSGTTHSFVIPLQVDLGNGTRMLFTSWNDGVKSASRAISHGGEYTANYKIQYKLIVESEYENPGGNGWYDSGSKATFSINPTEGWIIQHIFTGWSGDFTGQEATSLVTMDKSKTIKASWRNDYLGLYLLIIGFIVIVAGMTVPVVIRKKKK